MTIYSSAKLTEKLNVCEGGVERTKLALHKHGMEWESRLSGQWCLTNLGVHDTLFSMGRVFPDSRAEADALLRAYLGQVESLLLEMEPSMKVDNDWPELKLAKQCVKERVKGLSRERKWERASRELAESKDRLARATLIEATNVYLALLSTPMYLAATHAGKSLCELASYYGRSMKTYARLNSFIRQELGDE